MPSVTHAETVFTYTYIKGICVKHFQEAKWLSRKQKGISLKQTHNNAG